MSEERRRVLDLLAQGKVSAEEAEKLLRAVEPESGGAGLDGSNGGTESIPKYLFMVAHNSSKGEGSKEAFRIKVPLSLLRAGIKLKALVPEEARRQTLENLQARGIELDPFELSEDQFDDLVQSLRDFEMEAGDETGGFRIFLG